MSIPVGGGRVNRVNDLLPSSKPAPFEGERAQRLPPGLNQVQVRRILGLIDELPARMMQREEQQVVAMMDIQIVHDGVDTLNLGGELGIDMAEKVDEVRDGAPSIVVRPTLPRRFPQGSKDIAFATASIVNLLLGTLGWTNVHIDGLLTGIALGTHRSHFVDVEDGTVFSRAAPERFESPLF